MTGFKTDNNNEIFKKAVKSLKLRFPVADIHKKIGYEKGSISNFLNDRKPVSNAFLEKFAFAYGLNLEDFTDEPIKTVATNYNFEGVPYYDVDFAGGWGSDEIFSEGKPKFHILSPDFKRAEFACNLFGNSVSSRIPSGAIIGLKKVSDWQVYFPTNELYGVVLKNNLRTVKIVKKKDNNLVLIPDPLPEHNKTIYENETVPMDFVVSFFQIVAWGQFKRLVI
jgi:phage repressor protein C with HTH and peptisase S24 domain